MGIAVGRSGSNGESGSRSKSGLGRIFDKGGGASELGVTVGIEDRDGPAPPGIVTSPRQWLQLT